MPTHPFVRDGIDIHLCDRGDREGGGIVQWLWPVGDSPGVPQFLSADRQGCEVLGWSLQPSLEGGLDEGEVAFIWRIEVRPSGSRQSVLDTLAGHFIPISMGGPLVRFGHDDVADERLCLVGPLVKESVDFLLDDHTIWSFGQQVPMEFPPDTGPFIIGDDWRLHRLFDGCQNGCGNSV